MPIISRVGTRSWRVRAVFAAIYFVLVAGSVSMLYPFALMLSGSFKSDTDFYYISPYPEFWFDDVMLFQKYCESKYMMSRTFLENTWNREVDGWRHIEVPHVDDARVLREYLEWRDEVELPVRWYWLGHGRQWRLPHKNNRLFRQLLHDHFDGDLKAYIREVGLSAESWGEVQAPDQHKFSRQYWTASGMQELWDGFKRSRPRRDHVIGDLDGVFTLRYLYPRYSREIAEYNRRHGTSYDSYRDVFLARRVPAPGVERRDWEEFVRGEIPLSFLRLDQVPGLGDVYRDHLRATYGSIERLNARYESEYGAFAAVPLPLTAPQSRSRQVDWQAFIQDSGLCPTAALEIYSPRQAFEEFVARRRGLPLADVAPLRLPTMAADYHDAMADKAAIRWELSTRNYRQVLDYVLLHGRGILNTLIYCCLAVGTALIVNPLAAYALSRYKPPSTYKILLLCMATMAFPAEVAMIPSFLLLKRFPLWPLLGGALVFAVVLWALSKARPRWSEWRRLAIALGAGIGTGALAVPAAMDGGAYNVSLLNTFWALVLPGAANGFFIFLLKGFFDSLPRELYESAQIDGAREWTMFWTITMSLSKPILAVIALGAFTGAYSAFMMALIVIPDQDMWTLMVWVYQLQARSHTAVVFASLVITAIPTFLVFVFCQNIIIRGIVVPTEK